MIRIGSMQSNDILMVYDETHNGFQLDNLVKVLDDHLVHELVTQVLIAQGLSLEHLKVFFCGANEWVISARAMALKNLQEKEV